MEELKKREAELGFKLLYIDGKGMLKKTREIIDDKGVTVPVLLDSHSYYSLDMEPADLHNSHQ